MASAKKALKLFDQIEYNRGALTLKYLIAINLFNTGSEKESLIVLDEAYNIALKTSDTLFQIKTLSQKGYYDYTKSNYDDALENTIAALNILDSANCCLDEKILILNSLGIIYIDLKDQEKALEYLRQAESLINETNIRFQEPNVSINIGSIYLERKDYETAEIYLLKAHKSSLKGLGFRPEIYAIGLGKLYILKK